VKAPFFPERLHRISEIIEPDLAVKWVPDDAELAECTALGKRIAERVN